MQDYITISELSSKCQISTKTAYEWVHSKGFPMVKKGRVIRIPVNELEKWLLKQN